MNKWYKSIFGLFFYVLFSISFLLQSSCAQTISDKRVIVLELVLDKLSSEHFQKKPIDDAFSSNVFQEYLNKVDPLKFFFTEEDVHALSEKYIKDIDDEINYRTFEFFDEVEHIYTERVKNLTKDYEKVASRPISFDTDDTFDKDPKTFPKNETSRLERIWKYYKLSVFRSILLMERQKENAKKSLATLQKEATIKEDKSIRDFFFRISNISDFDRFSEYINSITEIFDPHTTYFSQEMWESFKTQISGEFQGIGATLSQDVDGVRVVDVVAGGPAWKQKALEPQDVIIFVRQDKEKDGIDVTKMKLSDVITKIKGPKDTIVNLTVKKPDGTIKEIAVQRGIVKMEEVYTKSAILSENGKKVGYIMLPQFYVPQSYNPFDQGSGERYSSEDVKKELIKMNKSGVDKIIFDIRGNGGGSLEEVINMVGHFITSGPVVQEKLPNKAPVVRNDSDNGAIVYKGKLLVLVDELSASASEIFAGAIQDYGRGILMGSVHTFGKGTVQTVIELNNKLINAFNNKEPLGGLKVTIQKFYRINGEANQLKGIESDIVIPTIYSKLNIGEKSEKFAMPWDTITSASYKKYSDLHRTIAYLKERSKERMEKSAYFNKVKKYADLFGQLEQSKVETLNYKKAKEKFFQEEKKPEDGEKNAFTVETSYNKNDEGEKVSYGEFEKKIKQDPVLQEAFNVLQDWR